MSLNRISGKSFHVYLGNSLIAVKKADIKISDGRTTVKTNGVPDGFVDGEVSAEGTIEVNTQYFNLIMQQAKKAGSFKEIPTFDLVFFAQTQCQTIKVEAFGCLIKIESLLDIDPKGGEDMTYSLPYEVTDPDFVHINGTPYLAASETEGLISA